MAKQIELPEGNFAVVDDENFTRFSKLKWNIDSWGYLVTGTKNEKMHQLVLGKKDGFVIDHINKNKLDNRIENLRHVPVSINNHNVGTRKNNTTGYKGVCLDRGKYRASIGFDGKNYKSKRFDSAIDAAKAYDEMAIMFYKEYADTNF